MLKHIKKLKVGSENTVYPMYAAYVYSDGNSLTTCNDENFVKIKEEVPFKGCVNLFVLENVLKSLNDGYNIVDYDGYIEIIYQNFKTTLNKLDIKMPSLPTPEGLTWIDIDDDIYTSLVEAQKCLSANGKYSYVMLTPYGIISSDMRKLYYNPSTITSTIGLNKKMISLLSIGDKVACDSEHNVFIKFVDGYAKLEADILSDYPLDKIKEFIDRTITNKKRVAGFSYIKSSLEKISTIFFGEKTPVIELLNENNKLRIIGESMLNGKAKDIIDSEVEDQFGIQVFFDDLKVVSLDYDLWYNESDLNTVIAHDDLRYFLIRGVN